MRLLLDGCVDVRLAEPLWAGGHDVALVRGLDPSADDEAVVRLALDAGRILVTTDLDFGELLVHTRLRSSGAVLMRLVGRPPAEVAARLGAALHGGFLVLDECRDRLRRLAPAPGEGPSG